MEKKPVTVHAYANDGKRIGYIILDPPLQEDSVGCCDMRAINDQLAKVESEDDIMWLDKKGNQYIYWQWDMFAEFYRADL